MLLKQLKIIADTIEQEYIEKYVNILKNILDDF